MPACHICFQTRFANWVEFHDHYVEHHAGNLKDEKTNIAAQIRSKAIATALNISKRSKLEIVNSIECLYPDSFINPDNNGLGEYYKTKVKPA